MLGCKLYGQQLHRMEALPLSAAEFCRTMSSRFPVRPRAVATVATPPPTRAPPQCTAAPCGPRQTSCSSRLLCVYIRAIPAASPRLSSSHPQLILSVGADSTRLPRARPGFIHESRAATRPGDCPGPLLRRCRPCLHPEEGCPQLLTVGAPAGGCTCRRGWGRLQPSSPSRSSRFLRQTVRHQHLARKQAPF
jgi:hypothetical protein